MQFHEKLIKLRKEKSMTQEDLAFRVGVSRQSVSKWELGESEPDLSNLKILAQIFNVSLDELVNDGAPVQTNTASEPPVRKISKQEADEFLSLTRKSAKFIAAATLLCILSPICLLLLGAMSEMPDYGISESFAGGVGMIVMLLSIAVAMTIFILWNGKTSPYSYLKKENILLEDNTIRQITEEQEHYRKRYVTKNILGSCLCILSLIPLFIGVIVNESNDLLLVSVLSLTFAIAGIGVSLFVHGGVIWGSFEKLLQTGDYTKK